jgi:hypothetical protein
LDYKLKKTVKYRTVFLKSSCKDIQNIKRDEVIAEKMGLTQTMLERMENMLKWYAHVVRMADNRWHKRILSDMATGRNTNTNRHKVEKGNGEGDEVEEFTSDDAVERQVWGEATEK